MITLLFKIADWAKSSTRSTRSTTSSTVVHSPACPIPWEFYGVHILGVWCHLLDRVGISDLNPGILSPVASNIPTISRPDPKFPPKPGAGAAPNIPPAMSTEIPRIQNDCFNPPYAIHISNTLFENVWNVCSSSFILFHSFSAFLEILTGERPLPLVALEPWGCCGGGCPNKHAATSESKWSSDSSAFAGRLN